MCPSLSSIAGVSPSAPSRQCGERGSVQINRLPFQHQLRPKPPAPRTQENLNAGSRPLKTSSAKVGGAEVAAGEPVSRPALQPLNSAQDAKRAQSIYKTPSERRPRRRRTGLGTTCPAGRTPAAPPPALTCRAPRSASWGLHRCSPERPSREDGGLGTSARGLPATAGSPGGPRKGLEAVAGRAGRTSAHLGLITSGAVSGASDEGGATSAPAHFALQGRPPPLPWCRAAFWEPRGLGQPASGRTRVPHRRRVGALQRESGSRNGQTWAPVGGLQTQQ